MTRSITITNTSNWDHEDYRFSNPDGEAITIKPGESHVFGPPDGWVMGPIEQLSPGQATPFMAAVSEDGKRRDKQVMPRVQVVFDAGEQSLENKVEVVTKMAYGTRVDLQNLRKERD